MDEFDINDSLDTLQSNESSVDSSESIDEGISAMDSVETPSYEDTSFENIENSALDEPTTANMEVPCDEVYDSMNSVEVEELTFEDEPVEITQKPELLETFESNSLEENPSNYLETMDEAETDTLEFDEQIEESYENNDNVDQEILHEVGSDNPVEMQTNIEPELLTQTENGNSSEFSNLENTSDMQEIELDSPIDNAESIEELAQIRNEVLQEGLSENDNAEETHDDGADLLQSGEQVLEGDFQNLDSLAANIDDQIDNADSIEELTQLRGQILQEGTQEIVNPESEDSLENVSGEDRPKTLVREITPEIIESRNADTEEVLDNYRENLREYGVDESVIEQYIEQERDKINAEYEALDRGDLDSGLYEVPTDWENVAARLKGEELDVSNIESSVELSDTTVEPEEITELIDPSEIDYDEVYEGLDSYDFDGIDYLQDAERLDNSLVTFQPERWKELDLEQQKGAMIDLAEYVQEVTGLENPPTIEFYNNPVDGDYGGYMASTNTLSINEHMLYDSNEAADTVAHELWHAYQHERAMNPQTAKDYQYQYNFEHYISPKRDLFGRFVNFTEYQDQLVEAEARAFAEQFKGRLGDYSG